MSNSTNDHRHKYTNMHSANPHSKSEIYKRSSTNAQASLKRHPTESTKSSRRSTEKRIKLDRQTLGAVPSAAEKERNERLWLLAKSKEIENEQMELITRIANVHEQYERDPERAAKSYADCVDGRAKVEGKAGVGRQEREEVPGVKRQ